MALWLRSAPTSRAGSWRPERLKLRALRDRSAYCRSLVTPDSTEEASPVRELRDRSTCTNLTAANPAGMRPERKLCDSHRRGMVPLRRLRLRLMPERLGSAAIDGGMAPESELKERSRKVSLVSAPRKDGTGPDTPVHEMMSMDRPESLPIAGGMRPKINKVGSQLPSF
ncbi:hypothetical protein EJB05_13737, partial [Eragrostis curvula]